MAGTGYIAGPNHAATVSAALDDFHRALTRRWREKVCAAVVADNHDYPKRFYRAVSPHADQPAWEHWSLPARHHLTSSSGCAFVRWVQAGQEGELSAVTCDGATDAREEVTLPEPQTGTMATVPPHIDCGMGELLTQVEAWAWAEREQIFQALPLFDHHDLAALEDAHDTFLEVGRRFVLDPKESESHASVGSFAPVDERETSQFVADISGESGEGQYWWSQWTGLAASSAQEGFFSSVIPTLHNQSEILGCLANLYSDRAAIIEKGRNDTLYWLQWATESLGATETLTTDRTNGWKAVQAIGSGVSIAGGWTAAGGAIGATMVLVGFLGENIDSGGHTEKYANGMEEVVTRVHDELDNLQRALDQHENDYYRAVLGVRTGIHGVHSYNLELYDLTANSPHGGRADPGYTMEVDSVLRIAERCYRVGEQYEELLPRLARTADADRHLADKSGDQTPADRAVVEVRDQLEQFLKTTCGRYFVASQQVKKSVEAYAETEDKLRKNFTDIMSDWERFDIGDYDREFDQHRYAQETERDHDPYEGHPAREGAEPGAGDGEGYVTEEDL